MLQIYITAFLIILLTTTASTSLISAETQEELLAQHNRTQYSLQQFLNLLYEHKTTPTTTTGSNLDFMAYQFAPVDDSCTVSFNKINKFRDQIYDVLGSSACEFDSQNPKNCEELAKLIQCTIGQIINAFLKSTDKNEALKWYGIYERLSGEYVKLFEGNKQSFMKEHKVQYEKTYMEVEKLHTLFGRIAKELKDHGEDVKKNPVSEDVKNAPAADDTSKELKHFQKFVSDIMVNLRKSDEDCFPIKFCPFKSWFYFSNDAAKFLKICEFVPDLISLIKDDKVEDAVAGFKKHSNSWFPYEIWEEVIAILYEQEGQNKLDNILKFITSVPWYGHRVYFIRKLVEEMKEKDEELDCRRLEKVIQSIEVLLEGKKYSRTEKGAEKNLDEEENLRTAELEAKKAYEEDCDE